MDWKKGMKDFMGRIGVIRFILLLICSIFLVIVSLPQKEENEFLENDERPERTISLSSDTNSIYLETMENRLEQILTSVEGAGAVDVMITLSASSETIVTKDLEYEETSEKEDSGKESVSSIRKEETVFTEESGKQKPYITKTIEPKVEGIVVVMEGGDDSSVVESVIRAVQALFPIETHKIGVLKMEDGQ